MTPVSAPNPEVVFFGYWSGVVPPVTELHFRSFLHHHPGARYELWLDQDHRSTLSPELAWLEAHPRIAVRRFFLDELIEKYVSERPVARYDRFGRLRRLGRALHRRAAPRWARTNAWEHSLFGLTYKHSSMLFHGFTRDKTYRGDVARCLLPTLHYPGPALYADLDVCFLADLRPLCGNQSWVYRWDRYAFANNALLYLPDDRAGRSLFRKGVDLQTFRPWILLSDDICKELDILIRPARQFDPLWDGASILYGDAGRFFGARQDLSLDLHVLAQEQHLAIHWHNHWKVVPSGTSLYAGLLRACKEAP